MLLTNADRYAIIMTENDTGDILSMKIIPIEIAYRQSCRVEVLNALKQKWTENETFSCIGAPKKQHMLLGILNCRAIYTLKDGKEISVPSNSIVYTPEGSEYRVRFVDCDANEGYNCIGINFKLYDESGDPFGFHDNVKIYNLKHTASVFESMHKIGDACQQAAYSPMRILGLFYTLLSDIGSDYHERHNILPKYNVIAKGIKTLESTVASAMQINDLARICNVSPIYFRKLFKEYSGTTPMEYKLNAMIAQAKQQLIYSDKPVWEIAEMLGFSSATYFCRAFKKRVGMTPMEYKNSQK